MMKDIADELYKHMPPPPYNAPEGLQWYVYVDKVETDYTVNFMGRWCLRALVEFYE